MATPNNRNNNSSGARAPSNASGRSSGGGSAPRSPSNSGGRSSGGGSAPRSPSNSGGRPSTPRPGGAPGSRPSGPGGRPSGGFTPGGKKPFGGGPRRGRRPFKQYVPLNEAIRFDQLRVIDQNGENLGVISKDEALQRAKDAELDLFIINEKADDPIAKILDYGKYKYENQKKNKQAKKKQTGVEVKEIKMRPNIDIGDYNTRLKHTVKFLEGGKKIKLNIQLRGREMQHSELATQLAHRFLDDLMELGHTDAPVKLQGRAVVVYIHPGPDKARIKKRDEEKDTELENS